MTNQLNRPPVSLLGECFYLRYDGLLLGRLRPTTHFVRAGSAQRVNRERAGTPAGCIGKDGYLVVRISLRGRAWLVLAQHIVWAMTRGEWPSFEIDHHDNNRANNAPDNLRNADRHQNMANMRAHHDNACGFKGVHLHKSTGKYRGVITHKRKRFDLGLYDTPEAAHAAYIEKSMQLNGVFARG